MHGVFQKSTGNGFNYPGRKKLLWDAQNMKITNFDEANQFVKREYREGWTLVRTWNGEYRIME